MGRPGLHGALLALSNSIRAAHLESALAWWDYNVKSVEMIFSDRTGNADADRIEAELLPGGETQPRDAPPREAAASLPGGLRLGAAPMGELETS